MHGSSNLKALFIQVTQPGAYPPLVNAAHLMVEAGWKVTFLASPIIDSKLKVPRIEGIDVIEMAERQSHIINKSHYLQYCIRSVNLALKIRPKVVYASDPIGAFPGLLAATACGAKLVYHEHDSPNSESELNKLFFRARRAAFARAALIIFPNPERAKLAQEQSKFDTGKLRIAWNVPRLKELPLITEREEKPFIVYYHGSINRDRPSHAVLEAVASFNGAARLDVAGYESPDSHGYVNELISRWNRAGFEVIRFLGEHQHSDLLTLASRCHAGLALMPLNTDNVNIKHLVGASNKAFDYMAAGLPLIVSDLPEWRTRFVEPGYGLYCNPHSANSIKTILTLLIQNPKLANDMSSRCRSMIEKHWNYEAAFEHILNELQQP